MTESHKIKPSAGCDWPNELKSYVEQINAGVGDKMGGRCWRRFKILLKQHDEYAYVLWARNMEYQRMLAAARKLPIAELQAILNEKLRGRHGKANYQPFRNKAGSSEGGSEG